MIPSFPSFEKLNIGHKKEIELHVGQFPPYSDYNFTSLWTYNTEDAIELSYLNDNLVIRFTDYLTLQPFYSFLGTRKISETADTLLAHSHEKKYEAVLKLIPEVVILADEKLRTQYEIGEDRDNHDYIVSAAEVVELPHHKYRTKSQQIAQFKNLYPHHSVTLMDLKSVKTQKQIMDLYALWKNKSGTTNQDVDNELIALSRLIAFNEHFDIDALGIFDRHTLIGFTIFETTHGNHGIYSFQKADRSYRGIFTFMCHEVAKILKEKGCTHINYEQDMGIAGLRNAKTLWKPVHYLKKYTISHKHTS